MKSEKNRPEERFDERANEDSYFAEKEYQLVEDMKTEFRKVAAARRETQMATCPKCSGKFAKYTIKGVVVERCESCQGLWLNKGELAGILRRQAAGPLGAFIERCFGKVEGAKKS